MVEQSVMGKKRKREAGSIRDGEVVPSADSPSSAKRIEKRTKSSQESEVSEIITAAIMDEASSRAERKRIRRERKQTKAIASAEEVARKERKRLRRERKEKETVTDAIEENDAPKQVKATQREHKQTGISENVSPDNMLEAKTSSKERRQKTKNSKGQDTSMASREKSIKNEASGNDKPKTEVQGQNMRSTADQWNPDALSGDAARKSKFLRLLGAGKSNGSDAPARISGSSKKLEDIMQVQNELEKQFEAGTRMKHDGQGKRRGLGA